jgi:predicted TIM-barrel fold metal-dependent hydrolase
MPSLDRAHREPAQPLPPLAADCHMHVFGPFARFPLARERAYTVAEAPLEAHERMKRQVGLERTVLVQASGYGTDNRAMLEALARLGSRGRAVAVLPPETPPPELQRLHAAGVRGLRLNFYTLAWRDRGAETGLFETYARMAGPLGWHLQIFVDPDTLLALAPALERARVAVVVDHMGMPDAAGGLEQPGFQALLRLLRAGRVWAKLAGADRITRASGRLGEALPFIRALAEAAPERLVWGSDWPNIGFHARKPVRDDAILPYRALDAGELLDLLAEAVPDAATRRAILADNPARLYGFE